MATDGSRNTKRSVSSDLGRPQFENPPGKSFDWKLFAAIAGTLVGVAGLLVTVFIFMIGNVYRAVDDLDRDVDTLTERLFDLSNDVAAIKSEVSNLTVQPDSASVLPEPTDQIPFQVTASQLQCSFRRSHPTAICGSSPLTTK